jgi:hypothetical protein
MPNKNRNEEDVDIDNIILEADGGVNAMPPRRNNKKGGKRRGMKIH